MSNPTNPGHSAISAHAAADARARLVYQCGLCGVMFPGAPVDDGPGVFQGLLGVSNQVIPTTDTLGRKVGPSTQPFTAKHACADGRWGLGWAAGMAPAGWVGGQGAS